MTNEEAKTILKTERVYANERYKHDVTRYCQVNRAYDAAISALCAPEREKKTLEDILEAIKREREFREKRHELEEMWEVDTILKIFKRYM